MAGISPSVTKIIFGDGAHSLVLLKELGIEKTCNLILDQKHLLDDWKLKFGHIWSTVSTLCTAIIYANTEPKYFDALDKLRLKVSSPSLLNYIENEINPIRIHFCYAWIKQYDMNLGRLGDQGAESNHSSYCQRISFGSFMEPVEQVTESIGRQQDISAELHNERYEKWHNDSIKASDWKIKGEDSSGVKKNMHDVNALLSLSPSGYAIWEHCKSEYIFCSMLPHNQIEGCFEIYRSIDQVLSQCNCLIMIENCSLCPHTLLFDNGQFVLSRFCQRFHRRIGVKTVRRIVNESLLSGPTNDEFGNEEPILDSLVSPGFNADVDNVAQSSILKVHGDAETFGESSTFESVGTNRQTDLGSKKKLTYGNVINLMKPYAELVSCASISTQDSLMKGFQGLYSVVDVPCNCPGILLQILFNLEIFGDCV